MKNSLILLAILLSVSGCETVSEKLSGQLVHVDIATLSDGCLPRRVEGDGGIQFFARRADGGVVFSASLYAQFGPTRDGGGLDSSRLDSVPPANPGAVLGRESACTGTIANWTLFDGGQALRLDQQLPGIDLCTSGPGYLPAQACEVARVFTLTPVGQCSLECVHVSEAGDVTCGC